MPPRRAHRKVIRGWLHRLVKAARWVEARAIIGLHPELALQSYRLEGSALHHICGYNYNDADSLQLAKLIIDASHTCPPVLLPNSELRTSVLTIRDCNGHTPLHLLYNSKDFAHHSLVKLILDSASDATSDCCIGDATGPVDGNVLCIDGRTSSMRQRAPSTHELLTAENKFGCTALHFLADKGSSICGAPLLLLEACQITHPINESSQNKKKDKPGLRVPPLHPLLVQDVEGCTPLLVACSKGLDLSLSFLSCLLEHAPSAVHVFDAKACTPADRLIKASFDLNDIHEIMSMMSINSLSYDGQPSKEQGGRTRLIENMKSTWLKIELILQAAYHGCLVNTSTDDDNAISNDNSVKTGQQPVWRPVHAAAGTPFFPSIVLKFAYHASSPDDVLTGDENGMLPLHIATSASLSYAAIITSNRSENGLEGEDKNKAHVESRRANESRVNVATLLSMYPRAAKVLTVRGRLPLHLAIENGHSIEELRELLRVEPRALTSPDMCTKLYPFMLAAVGNNYTSLNVAFELLLESPELVEMKNKSAPQFR